MFYYTKDIDRWGSGFQRIKKECEENNIKFNIKLLNNGLLVVFYRTKDKKTTQKTTQKILKLIKENPEITRREIVAALGNISDAGVKYQLAKMKQTGIIKRIGPDKGGHWQVVENQSPNNND